MDFGELVAVCALLLRTRAKRRKRFWVHPLVSQRLLKGQFHKLYEDLHIHPKKFFGYFRMTCSGFYKLSSMIRPKITYQNTVMRASVLPEERLARRMVECAFGILCNKWRIFHCAIDVCPDI
jgi:hypothetical protein